MNWVSQCQFWYPIQHTSTNHEWGALHSIHCKCMTLFHYCGKPSWERQLQDREAWQPSRKHQAVRGLDVAQGFSSQSPSTGMRSSSKVRAPKPHHKSITNWGPSVQMLKSMGKLSFKLPQWGVIKPCVSVSQNSQEKANRITKAKTYRKEQRQQGSASWMPDVELRFQRKGGAWSGRRMIPQASPRGRNEPKE